MVLAYAPYIDSRFSTKPNVGNYAKHAVFGVASVKPMNLLRRRRILAHARFHARRVEGLNGWARRRRWLWDPVGVDLVKQPPRAHGESLPVPRWVGCRVSRTGPSPKPAGERSGPV